HSDAKLAQAMALGLQGGVNYGQTDWSAQAKALAGGGFDLIVDGAGGAGFGDLLRLLNPAARLVYYGGTRGKWPQILPQRLFYRQVDLLASTMGSPEEMDALLAYVQTHQIQPVVAHCFPLAKGAEAFAYLEANQQFGKVVLEMTANDPGSER
ncbi:MAG: zinc-binding dehydrogenase, partial [Myxococcota bacterium]|nr:zinc-binding dehydrogenase [Myxococcota bacterium]